MPKWNRVFFIDGPEHGTTRTLESEPLREILVPGQLIYNATSYLPEIIQPAAYLPVHKYYLTYQTRNGTWIYEYAGQIQG